MSTTALCSTVHPAVMPYVAAWFESVEAQADRDFDVWIAVDGVSVDKVREHLGVDSSVHLLGVPPGAKPATVRTLLFELVTMEYDHVVLVDADDLLEPTRVSAAKRALIDADAASCALRLVDSAGNDLGLDFCSVGVSGRRRIGELIARVNVFGLSNTAYRGRTLRAALPIPPECIAVDWYLATAAWARGANLVALAAPHMRYRQHESNVTCVLAPFSLAAVKAASDVVELHQRLAAGLVEGLSAQEARTFGVARDNTSTFRKAMQDPQQASEYVRRLNELPCPQAWWAIVAHPELEDIWMS